MVFCHPDVRRDLITADSVLKGNSALERFFPPLRCVQNDRLHCHPDVRRDLITADSVPKPKFCSEEILPSASLRSE